MRRCDESPAMSTTRLMDRFFEECIVKETLHNWLLSFRPQGEIHVSTKGRDLTEIPHGVYPERMRRIRDDYGGFLARSLANARDMARNDNLFRGSLKIGESVEVT